MTGSRSGATRFRQWWSAVCVGVYASPSTSDLSRRCLHASAPSRSTSLRRLRASTLRHPGGSSARLDVRRRWPRRDRPLDRESREMWWRKTRPRRSSEPRVAMMQPVVSHASIAPDSRGLSLVELQDTAEPLADADAPASKRRRPRRERDDVVDALVITLRVVVLDVLLHDMSQVSLSEGDDMPQALALDRSHEPLRIGVQVRAASRKAKQLYVRRGKDLREPPRPRTPTPSPRRPKRPTPTIDP